MENFSVRLTFQLNEEFYFLLGNNLAKTCSDEVFSQKIQTFDKELRFQIITCRHKHPWRQINHRASTAIINIRSAFLLFTPAKSHRMSSRRRKFFQSFKFTHVKMFVASRKIENVSTKDRLVVFIFIFWVNLRCRGLCFNKLLWIGGRRRESRQLAKKII